MNSSLISPSSLWRRLWRRLRRYLQTALGLIWGLTPILLGFGIVLTLLERWGGVRLLGGFAPGRVVALLLGLAGLVILLRHARLIRAVQRRRTDAGTCRRLLAGLLHALRAIVLGALMAVLTVRTFHPVRATSVFVVIHLGDQQNDVAFATEFLDRCKDVHVENPDREIEYGTRGLNRLVTAALAGRSSLDTNAWWEELKRQPPAAERLSQLRDRLSDRFGEQVYVISVERPSAKVQPWPLWPEHVYCRWLCVDPSDTPRTDRTQLLSYCINQDAAAAPYLTATLAVKQGEAVPEMVVALNGASPLRTQTVGSFGDHYGYQVTIPRNEQVKSVWFEADGVPIRIDPITDFRLAPRRLKVKLAPGLELIRSLAVFQDEKAGPIQFTSAGEDVEWGIGPQGTGDRPYVEFLPGTLSYDAAATGFRLARTPAGLTCPLGTIVLPKAGSEFRDFSPGLLLEAADKRLIDLSREPDPASPLVFHRNANMLGNVTIITPPLSELARLDGNLPAAMGKLIVWATSLASRAGKAEPLPIRLWRIDAAAGIDVLTESGPPNGSRQVHHQLADALTGRLDGNRRFAAANSLRDDCGRAAWGLLSALGALTAGAAIVSRIKFHSKA